MKIPQVGWGFLGELVDGCWVFGWFFGDGFLNWCLKVFDGGFCVFDVFFDDFKC